MNGFQIFWMHVEIFPSCSWFETWFESNNYSSSVAPHILATQNLGFNYVEPVWKPMKNFWVRASVTNRESVEVTPAMLSLAITIGFD